MVIRKQRKKNKLRGNRTHGKGNTANKRGGGSRGGRGRAGSKKHKYNTYPEKFQKKKDNLKQKKLKPKQEKITSINLIDLNYFIKKNKGKLKTIEKDGKKLIDLRKAGINKILSYGNIEFQVLISKGMASKKALEKMLKTGSVIE
ncbi:MAG: uL15 family ribosomal protein [archaeon]